jgi:hypothetical protein
MCNFAVGCDLPTRRASGDVDHQRYRRKRQAPPDSAVTVPDGRSLSPSADDRVSRLVFRHFMPKDSQSIKTQCKRMGYMCNRGTLALPGRAADGRTSERFGRATEGQALRPGASWGLEFSCRAPSWRRLRSRVRLRPAGPTVERLRLMPANVAGRAPGALELP